MWWASNSFSIWLRLLFESLAFTHSDSPTFLRYCGGHHFLPNRLVRYYVGCRPLTTSRLSRFLISLTMGGHHFFSFLNWHPLIVLHSFKPRFSPAVNHYLLIPLWWLHALLFLNHLVYAFLSIFFPTLTWLMWILEPWTATSCTLIFHHAFRTTASPGKCTPE